MARNNTDILMERTCVMKPIELLMALIVEVKVVIGMVCRSNVWYRPTVYDTDQKSMRIQLVYHKQFKYQNEHTRGRLLWSLEAKLLDCCYLLFLVI